MIEIVMSNTHNTIGILSVHHFFLKTCYQTVSEKVIVSFLPVKAISIFACFLNESNYRAPPTKNIRVWARFLAQYCYLNYDWER